MRTLFPSESCKEPQLNIINPQLWFQVERGKLSKFAHQSPSSIESLIKVPEPPILPVYKPVDYVEVLAQIHEELESYSPEEKSNLYLLQYQVFKGLGDAKLMRRSLRSAWLKASSVYEKLVFGAWLKYEKQGEDIISDLLLSCGKRTNEFGAIDVASEFPTDENACSLDLSNGIYNHLSQTVSFLIGNEKIPCNRHKIAKLSAPFHAMLNGCFTESISDEIDLSENNISPSGMRTVSDFSETGCLNEVLSPSILLEILVFANRFCCEGLKDACDKNLASLVSSRQDAIELMECALEENSPVLAASCLQVFLNELPDSLNDQLVVNLLSSLDGHQRLIKVGSSSFSLYSLLSEVAINLDPSSDTSVLFSSQLVGCASASRQKVVALHQLGCVKLFRKEYDEAEKHFEASLKEGHIYSVVGLARLSHIKGHKDWSYEKMRSVISSCTPLGWMYQERSLYCDDDKKFADLEKATELDPTLTYPYMYRAASLMRKRDFELALVEINRVLGFKLALECLELRFCFFLALDDYQSAICDVQAILTLSPNYRMFDGRVLASQLRILVREHVENWTTADC
ncbi:hypothetical protein RD792_003319 [Penstemon davidsonii]|uniref:BTB domain-containing protein n=1 Tax=Penstemon davidsonii TaxID=160366 RepID=A0ABR0DUK4_9LAMI|nr:hypothetical protein RD792_003319 [Penstemon davidsonii]